MIQDYTKFFNQDNKVFKALVVDKDNTELSIISNVNDLNKGAIHNTLEWTRRWGLRCIEQANLQTAKGFLLDAFGELLGEERNASETDDEFKNRILATVLLTVSTINNIYQLINNENVIIRENMLSGFLDHSFLDIGVNPNNPIASSAMTFSRNSIYIIFRSKADFSSAGLVFLNSIKAAGTAIFIGFIFPGDYDYLYLDGKKGFMDSDFFLGDIPVEIYNPSKVSFLDSSHLDNTFTGVP